MDNYTSFCECIEHLITVHGYQKIGFVGGLKEHPDTKERLIAYQKTMEKPRAARDRNHDRIRRLFGVFRREDFLADRQQPGSAGDRMLQR